MSGDKLTEGCRQFPTASLSLRLGRFDSCLKACFGILI